MALSLTLLVLRPGQTLATFQRNILQHCWAQHVAYVWPPCCEMLRCVATCWLMLDQIWKRSNFSCNILDVALCCTRLATFTQHCCARACALGSLAIATRNVRVRQRPGAHKQRHVVMNVAWVWPARSITVATSCNNVARCCVEMLRAFGQAFKLPINVFRTLPSPEKLIPSLANSRRKKM